MLLIGKRRRVIRNSFESCSIGPLGCSTTLVAAINFVQVGQLRVLKGLDPLELMTHSPLDRLHRLRSFIHLRQVDFSAADLDTDALGRDTLE